MRHSFFGSMVAAFMVAFSWSVGTFAAEPPSASASDAGATPNPAPSAGTSTGTATGGSADAGASAAPGTSASGGADGGTGGSAGASKAPGAPAATTGTAEGAATLPPLTTAPPSDEAPLPPPLPQRRRIRYGAQFRFEGAPMGDDAASGAGMGGFGLSFRPRPHPHFAVDIGVDFIGGRDFNGEKRFEQALLVTPMLFINPKNRATLYLLAGVGFSTASVEHADATSSRYNYIGVHAGAGVEVQIWRRIALSGDFVAFVRDHTDGEINRRPEFFDPATRRYTNTSKGALLRLGIAYYW